MVLRVGGIDSLERSYDGSLPGMPRKTQARGEARSAGSDAKVRPSGPTTSEDVKNGREAAQSSQKATGDSSTQVVDPKIRKQIETLKKRDIEVRAHEQAHLTAGRQYVRGGPSYEFTSGPDGNKYATGGEVSIDVSTIPGDPEGTIRKMAVVKKAALAPAKPSPQDYGIAATADNLANQARRETLRSSFDKTGAAGQAPSNSKGTLLDITA